MSLSKRIGIIVIVIVVAFGTFCTFDLFREFNIKNQIIGYFQNNSDTVKINDFEYEINALLFKNSGNNESEYYAEANASPVSDFDITKKYTISINDILANRVYGDYSYINANFTNTFYAINDKELLTDTLNIKINFYTEGTRIIFTTQNGEQAIKLWASYIQKNGFTIKIIEDSYTPQIEADNLIEYEIYLWREPDEALSETIDWQAVDVIRINALSDEVILPTYINNQNVKKWTDINGMVYTTAPLQNINLYAELYPMYTVNYYVGNEIEYFVRVDDSGKTNRELPTFINYKQVEKWTDINGNIYTKAPLQNINLYAHFYDSFNVNLYLNNELYLNSTNKSDFTLPGEINGIPLFSWKDENGTVYTTETLPEVCNLNLYSTYIYYNITLAKDCFEEYVSGTQSTSCWSSSLWDLRTTMLANGALSNKENFISLLTNYSKNLGIISGPEFDDYVDFYNDTLINSSNLKCKIKINDEFLTISQKQSFDVYYTTYTANNKLYYQLCFYVNHSDSIESMLYFIEATFAEETGILNAFVVSNSKSPYANTNKILGYDEVELYFYPTED